MPRFINDIPLFLVDDPVVGGIHNFLGQRRVVWIFFNFSSYSCFFLLIGEFDIYLPIVQSFVIRDARVSLCEPGAAANTLRDFIHVGKTEKPDGSAKKR